MVMCCTSRTSTLSSPRRSTCEAEHFGAEKFRMNSVVTHASGRRKSLHGEGNLVEKFGDEMRDGTDKSAAAVARMLGRRPQV